MTTFMDLFNKENRTLATKALDYYDGKSKEYLLSFLNVYRKNAVQKGLVPRTRNLTKDVIDKSGMLFSGRPPQIKVFPKGSTEIDENASLAAQDLFESASWMEFFNNFDSVVRMLKTAFVLAQYDQENNQVIFSMLGQHNAAVHAVNGRVDTLIYFTGKDGNVDTYRVWNPVTVFDLHVTNGDEVKLNEVPNPFGMVPVAVFHDTNTPRDGVWNQIPEDLIEINDIYNLFVSTAEYSGHHALLPTLFTNAQIQGSNGLGIDPGFRQEDYGSALGPRMVTGAIGQGFVGGPGEAVAIDANGQSVFLDYKGPNPQIEPLDRVVKGWFADFARDWSVTTEDQAGNGAADSGFKLVVKEMPNMELRKKRQRMMEAGFKRLYSVLLKISEVYNLGLAPDTELFLQFSAPELPVDEKSAEEVWSRKIKEGRATDVDYFMVQHGMSREEAQEKVRQIAEDKALIAGLNTATPAAPTDPVTTNIVI